MTSQPARWSRARVVAGVVGVAALTAGTLWWWRRRQRGTSESSSALDAVMTARYNGAVDIRHDKFFYSEEVQTDDAERVKYIFESVLYTQPYGVIPEGVDTWNALLQCGRMQDLVHVLGETFCALLSRDLGATLEDSELNVIEEKALFVYEFSPDPTERKAAQALFMQVLEMRDSRSNGTYIQNEGSELAMTFAYGVGDLEVFRALSKLRFSKLKPPLNGPWGADHLGGANEYVHAACVVNNWGDAQEVSKRVLDAVALYPQELSRPVTAVLLARYIAPISLWNGDVEAAVRLLGHALSLNTASDGNVMLSLLNCGEETDEVEPATFEGWDEILNNDELRYKIERFPATPSTAPSHVPPSVPHLMFRLGQCVRAFTLYGPRDPQSGALLTPRAEFAEAYITLQFVSCKPITDSEYVYVVGKWFMAKQPAAPPVNMYWRIATPDLIHTNVTLTSPPLPGTRAGIHRIHLEFYSDPAARREHRLGVLNQPVWCPMDCAAVTERESRAMWRYAREGDQDAVSRLYARRASRQTAAQPAHVQAPSAADDLE